MIIIHATADSTAGIGNMARAVFLAEYLEGLCGVSMILETDATIAAFFNISEKVEKYVVGNRDEALKLMQSFDTQNGVYISDLLHLEYGYADELKPFMFKYTIHINDDLANGYIPDILIDEDPFEKERFHGRVASYFGSKYKIFRKSLLNYRPLLLPEARFNKILVTFGGSDPASYTERIAEIAGSNGLNNISFILGPAMPEERKSLCRKLAPQNKFYDNVNELAPIINEHDIIIGLGGLTAYETALMGKIYIGVKWGHMAYYVDKLHNLGLLYKVEGIPELEEMLLNMGKYESVLSKTLIKSFNIADGNGGYAVREIVREAL